MVTDTIGGYIQNIVQMSFRIAPLNEGHNLGLMDGRFFIGHGGFHGHLLLGFL